MRKLLQIAAFLTIAEGFLFAFLAKDYAKVLRTDKFGTTYLEATNALVSLPDKTIRLGGVAQMLAGTALLSFAGRESREVELEETVSGERFVQILRGLADAMESTGSFMATIKGQQVRIPSRGTTSIEFEQKDGGGEFELEVEW